MADRSAPRPWQTTSSAGGLVCSVDHLASSAGARLLADGGTAADAAIATSAALAVTSPHMCGMGGDLFALVHRGPGPPEALVAAGRAGSGADPERVRAEGHTTMPFTGDVRSAPVPGCVDGWIELHRRHGRRPLTEVLAPARRLAEGGFPASPLLAVMLPTLAGTEEGGELAGLGPEPGERVVRPELAGTLAAVADGGRDAFYRGAFGEALLVVGAGEYTEADLARSQAEWVEPLGLRVWGHDLWTAPPVSQGYASLAAAGIIELVAGEGLPSADAAAWAHLLVEANRLAASDRPAVLFEGADGEALLAPDRLAERAARFDPDRASAPIGPGEGGGTVFLCAVDAEGAGVSLIQSNAKDFGARVAVPGTGVLVHNRGIGFSLEVGHPAEYGPGRRPPHTLAPAVLTRADGSLRAVLGTMGGDTQPQVVTQMVTRLLVGAQSPGEVIAAPRFALSSGTQRGFDTWTAGSQLVRVEAHAPEGWAPGLAERGHRSEVAGFDPAGFGHAHLIETGTDGIAHGAADPRALTGAAVAAV